MGSCKFYAQDGLKPRTSLSQPPQIARIRGVSHARDFLSAWKALPLTPPMADYFSSSYIISKRLLIPPAHLHCQVSVSFCFLPQTFASGKFGKCLTSLSGEDLGVWDRLLGGREENPVSTICQLLRDYLLGLNFHFYKVRTVIAPTSRGHLRDIPRERSTMHSR
jgi:hypothetical protein